MTRPILAIALLASLLVPACIESADPCEAGQAVQAEVAYRHSQQPRGPGITGDGSQMGLHLVATIGGDEVGGTHIGFRDARMDGHRVIVAVHDNSVDGLTGVPDYPAVEVWLNQTVQSGSYELLLCVTSTYPLGDDRVEHARYRSTLVVD